MKEFQNIWVERRSSSFFRSFLRSFARGIHRKRVRKVRRAPSAPRSTFRRAQATRKKTGGGTEGAPGTVAHVLDRGSTGLRSSRGSYVPFCINRETPRRTRTSGRFWNRLNPPAPRDQKGWKCQRYRRHSIFYSLFFFFPFSTARGEKYAWKCWDGIPSFRFVEAVLNLNNDYR